MKFRLPVWEEIPTYASLVPLFFLFRGGHWQGPAISFLIALSFLISGNRASAGVQRDAQISYFEKQRILEGILLTLVAAFGMVGAADGFFPRRLCLGLLYGAFAIAVVSLGRFYVQQFGFSRDSVKKAVPVGLVFFIFMALPLISIAKDYGFNREAKLYEYSLLGNKEQVQALLALGTSPNATINGKTALTVALMNGKEEVAIALLEAGANPGLDSRGIGTSLHALVKADYAFSKGSRKFLIENVIRHGASIHQTDGMGETPFFIALRSRDIETAEMLLAVGANLNFQNPAGETSLIRAVQGNDVAGVDFLLRKNCDRNIRDRNGKTALDYAEGRPVLLALLKS